MFLFQTLHDKEGGSLISVLNVTFKQTNALKAMHDIMQADLS